VWSPAGYLASLGNRVCALVLAASRWVRGPRFGTAVEQVHVRRRRRITRPSLPPPESAPLAAGFLRIRASLRINEATIAIRWSAPTQHAVGNSREPTRNNGQRPAAEYRSSLPVQGRINATTCGYQRTSSPVTALPMIMRWISDVPSKMVKLMEVRPISAGRCPVGRGYVSTNSAPGRRSADQPDAWFSR
jgi:hypothetical protein